ncbi:hypothetical protein A6E15_01055 [Natrinema saccharevitans]|uniref:Uncharacterized protein n=1 Tax=Natrinema saccharevitans TaxID=301967 RepID=A0A1S8ASG4_9EURY|nr:hypothetical protein [Natrinema saccharevitans]OLZ39655.1 hypothetical protein A6E15_01055 [Natrinema saccharevitans]
MPSAYCDECGWEYRTDGADGELSRAMIDHFVETGHSPVERRDADDRLETDGDRRGAEEQSPRCPEPGTGEQRPNRE